MPINCFLHRFPIGSLLITIYSSIFQRWRKHAWKCYCLLSSVLIHLKTVKLDPLPVFPSCIDIGFFSYTSPYNFFFSFIFSYFGQPVWIYVFWIHRFELRLTENCFRGFDNVGRQNWIESPPLRSVTSSMWYAYTELAERWWFLLKQLWSHFQWDWLQTWELPQDVTTHTFIINNYWTKV